MNASAPLRGEIWFVDLDPARGHEQSGRRPCLILSVDDFNSGPADLVVVIPVSTKFKGVPLHVAVDPPQGGLHQKSYVKCEDVRSISKKRLVRKWGRVSNETMADVEDRIRILLDL